MCTDLTVRSAGQPPSYIWNPDKASAQTNVTWYQWCQAMTLSDTLIWWQISLENLPEMKWSLQILMFFVFSLSKSALGILRINVSLRSWLNSSALLHWLLITAGSLWNDLASLWPRLPHPTITQKFTIVTFQSRNEMLHGRLLCIS